jgi:hypothetical protein
MAQGGTRINVYIEYKYTHVYMCLHTPAFASASVAAAAAVAVVALEVAAAAAAAAVCTGVCDRKKERKSVCVNGFVFVYTRKSMCSHTHLLLPRIRIAVVL